MKIENILFDVDSTLVTFEGLDFIAEAKGKKQQVERLTAQAMNGHLPMREAMKIKLDIIRPNFFDLVKLGEAYVKNVVPGVKETIHQLKKAGYEVWILTGNFQPAVGILANFLCIPLSHVITNEIWFDDQGHYVSFSLDHPLSNNGGKAKIIRSYGKRLLNSIMIGDGAT